MAKGGPNQMSNHDWYRIGRAIYKCAHYTVNGVHTESAEWAWQMNILALKPLSALAAIAKAEGRL